MTRTSGRRTDPVSPSWFAALPLVFALAACPAGTTTPDAGAPACDPDTADCACRKPSDCGSIARYTCLQAACVRLCSSSTQCREGLTCDEGLCRALLCAEDADCAATEQCLEGSCAPKLTAASVASCLVLPARASLRSDLPASFTVFTRDTNGVGLPYRGEVTWSSEGPTGAAGLSSDGTSATLTPNAFDGTLELHARIGAVECEAAQVESYEGPAEGKLRVVVVDSMSARPVPGVRVLAKTATFEGSADTDARGVAKIDVPQGLERYDLHAFARLHSWVSYASIRARDVVVHVKPRPFRNGFTGGMQAADFEGLAAVGESAHFALFGSSIPPNLLDLQTATFFGDLHSTHVRLGETEADLLMPSGAVFGIDDVMFRDWFDIYAPPGVRTAWGLGGNASFSGLFSALAPLLLGDGRVDTGELLARILPLVNGLQHGLAAGRRTPLTSDLDPIDLRLDTPLRLKVRASIPALPTYRRGANEHRTEGAFLVAVADQPSQGLVPLGLTAGLDGDDADGLLDATDPGLPAGTLPLRLAPRRHGLEAAQVQLVTVAVSFSRLGLGGDRDPDAPLVFSALVQPLDGLRAGDGLDVAIQGNFLEIPNDAALTNRSFTRTRPVTGAHVTRLDVGDAWKGEWSVWLADDVNDWAFPVPPEGFDDRLHPPEPDPEAPVTALLHSARLDDPPTLDALVTFDGVDPDTFGGRLRALSSRQLPIRTVD